MTWYDRDVLTFRPFQLVALVGLSSCTFDTGGIAPTATPDARTGDVPAILDFHTESVPGDLGPGDGPADAPRDAIVDTPTEGPLNDGPLVDVTPDVAAPDGPLPDTQPPPPPPACASGSPSFVFAADKMVICSTSNKTQCTAHTACNEPAWHLCTASEYLARGGKTIVPPSSSVWLAACIRSGGGQVHAPTDGVCPACNTATASNVCTAWPCTGGSCSFTRSDAELGIGTKNGCRRVGVNDPATGAYWTMGRSSTLLPGAVCCY